MRIAYLLSVEGRQQALAAQGLVLREEQVVDGDVAPEAIAAVASQLTVSPRGLTYLGQIDYRAREMQVDGETLRSSVGYLDVYCPDAAAVVAQLTDLAQRKAAKQAAEAAKRQAAAIESYRQRWQPDLEQLEWRGWWGEIDALPADLRGEYEAERARRQAVHDEREAAKRAEAERLADAWLAGDAAGFGGRLLELLDALPRERRVELRAESDRRAEAVKLARVSAKLAYLRSWIDAHGTDSQRERAAVGDSETDETEAALYRRYLGLVPEDEVIDAIRDHVFAPLAELPRYQRLTRDDLEGGSDDEYHQHDASYESQEALDVPPDVWESVKRVRAKLPAGATSAIRVHVATCDSRDCDAEARRFGVLVTLKVAEGLELHREYAAE